jgi:uncharacterized membrane protein YcjF (UPF0283 family)
VPRYTQLQSNSYCCNTTARVLDILQLVEDEWERLATLNEKAKSEQDVAQLQASSATAARAAQEERKRYDSALT